MICNGVQHGHHGGVAARGFGPGFVLVQRPGRIGVGDVEITVRRREGQVGEERSVAVCPDEIHRLVEDHVLRVGLTRTAAVVPGEGHLLAVANQIRRVIRVRVHLIIVADEDIETVFLRHAGRAAAAVAPLAEAPRGVAEGLQD